MGYKKISADLNEERMAKIIAKIEDLKAELDFLINLSNEERKRLRKAAEKRQGYVNDIMIAVKANPTAIPSAIDTDEYYFKSRFFLNMSTINMHMKPLTEGVSDTLVAASHEAITLTDQCYGFLKQAARGSSILTDTVSKLAKHHAKTKAEKPKVE